MQFVNHALYLKHSSVYPWKWEEFAKIIFAIEFFFFSDSFKQWGLSMTPDFPSPTQLDYKYFSSSDHNSTKICSCLRCTSCTSPVLLTAGLCQHSSWKGLHAAEVYPCCPSNTTTQPSHQELGPALIPCRAAAADCWFTQLPQAEPSPWGHPSKGADTRRQLRQQDTHWDPLRNLRAHLFPGSLHSVSSATSSFSYGLTFLFLSNVALSLCNDLLPLLCS